MKSIVTFALLGALLFVAIEARPSGESSSESDESDNGKGVAGFPVSSLRGGEYVMRAEKIAQTFNEYAKSGDAYKTEKVNKKNLVKITGTIIVSTDHSDSDQMLSAIYVDRYGRIFAKPGQSAIEDVEGIIGGDEKRMNRLSPEALSKIKKGFHEKEAFLSSLPNDVWIFGRAVFDNAATIAAGSAKMVQEFADGTFSKAKKLSKVGENDLKLLMEGAGKGLDAVKTLAGVAVGTPLAIGSNVVKHGADLVSNGAGFFGKFADNVAGFGMNLAGLKKKNEEKTSDSPK